MKPEDAIAKLSEDFQQALVNGLNAGAEVVLADITMNVQVQTGRLRDSYHITQSATPENLEVEVGSLLEYRLFNYPHTPNPGATSPGFSDGTIEEEVKQAVEAKIQEMLG